MKAIQTGAAEALSFFRQLVFDEDADLTETDMHEWEAAIERRLSEMEGANQIALSLPKGSSAAYSAAETIDASMRQLREDVAAYVTRSNRRTRALNARCEEYEKRLREGDLSAEERARLQKALVW